MKIDLSKILKTAAKSSFFIASRMIGFGLVGIAMNAAMLFLMRTEMASVISSGGSAHFDGGGGGALAVIFLFVLLIAYWPVTLICLGFGLVFPALYFIFGQKHGVKKAIQYCVKDNRELISEYTIDRLWSFAADKSGLKEKADAALTRSKILQLLPLFMKKLNNMPRPMRLVARHYINKIDFGGIVTRAIEPLDEKAPINFEMVSNTLKERTAEKVEEKLFKPDLKWFGILAAVNIAICVIIKIIL